MKNLIFLVLVSCFVFFACEKDIVKHETKDIYVELSAFPNMEVSPVQCTPQDKGLEFINGGGLLAGEVSELGALIKESSQYTMVNCEFGPGENQITETAIIRMKGVNGDFIDAEGKFIITQIPNNPPGFSGGVVITGGSGKYVGAIGSINIDPESVVYDFQVGSLSWTGSGYIKLNGFNSTDDKS